MQVAGGVIGQQPVKSPVNFELQVNVKGRLISEEEFGNIIVKAGPNGEKTLLKDVARIELGAGSYGLRSLLNNKTAVAIPIFQTPGANALELSKNVRAKMEELKKNFPEGIDYSVVYDPTVFVRHSIEAVIHTLLEAILLVVIVVIIFLQTWRAAIIPLAAVPVSLIGTFSIMLAFGFSINALSLFGLVLAIGIVVDDAIVVVENVERNIARGLSSYDAARQAMNEVTGPIVATALVLCAVFVPTAFISGLTGQFYKQFALTIAISTVISAFNSLTLSPALCAVLLKDHHAPKDWLSRIDGKSVRLVFSSVQPRFRLGGRINIPAASRSVLRKSVIALDRLWRTRFADRLEFQQSADRLRAGAGQTISRRVRAIARRLVARPHGSGDSPHVRHRHETAGRGFGGRVSRLEHQRIQRRAESGNCFLHVETV